MITVLTGGTGGAKFAQGLNRVVPPEEVAYVVNTGDDLTWWGLHVSPDIDSIVYALGGVLSKERGWGVDGDSFHCLDAARKLGQPAWFQLGDRDLATHILRTRLLSEGRSLSEATHEIARLLGVRSRVLPMSNERVETRVSTAIGELGFQEYFVRERYQVEAFAVHFDGAEQAAPAPDVREAILSAGQVIIAPSNPVTSIGPILAVPSVRDALRRTSAAVVAISPIIGEFAVSGPAGALMKARNWPVSIAGVAQAYADFLDVLVADVLDSSQASAVENFGVRAHFTQTLMRTDSDKRNLAAETLRAAGRMAGAAV